MYSASDRAAYAALHKTAAGEIAGRAGTILRNAMQSHPMIAAAIAAAVGGLGGHAMARAQGAREQASYTQGLGMGHAMGRS